jgi:FkbM family methyltransferase
VKSALHQRITGLLRAAGIKAYAWKKLSVGMVLERDLERIFINRSDLVLLDVGANEGQTTLRLHNAFPAATIHAFEPVSSTFNLLQRSTSGMNGLFLHKCAAGNRNGRATMSVGPESEWNKISPALGASGTRSEEDVEMVTLDAFLEQKGISSVDLLKTDCEGYDLEVILGAEKALRQGRVSAVLCEVNLRGDGFHTDFFALNTHLSARGYYFFAFYDYAGWGHLYADGQYQNALWLLRPQKKP